jgi:formate hydrogenlyase subunit 6/NADH:ubiquinone oxidoreductase subunit I
MDTGPRARAGHDLAMTELGAEPGGDHRLVVEIGSERGAALVARVPRRAATDADVAAARAATDAAAAAITRAIDRATVRERLLAALEHPRWEAIAGRCLGCASCTLSCPTCFCVTVDDTTDLAGDVATRSRRWDSCFSAGYAYVHGGSARPSLRARYRQWLTHKLATWHDQFGSAGCVGCGRCTTWCPVGIDLCAEVAALTAVGERSRADG